MVTLSVFFWADGLLVKNEEIMTFLAKKKPTAQTYENPVSLSHKARNSNIVFHFSPLMQHRFD
jgi:hypothetical protein